MSLISLWIRVFSLILFCILGVVIICICGRKLKRVIKCVLSVAVIIVFMFGVIDVSISMIHPKIKTFVGIYEELAFEASSINIIPIEYCFVVDGEKRYVDTDVISSRVLCPDGLEPGCAYEIMVESNQNLLVSAKKMD